LKDGFIKFFRLYDLYIERNNFTDNWREWFRIIQFICSKR